MQPSRYSYLVLNPSLFSVALSLFVGLITLGAANWSYVLHDILFYDYFFGEGGVVSAMLQPGSDDTLIKSVFSQSFLNNTIVIGISLGIGVAFYLALEGIRHIRDPLPPLPRREARQRALSRLVIGAIWVIFIQLSIKVILPFCILATQVGIKALWGWKGFLIITFGLLIFMACWHIHTILLRLFLLRVRAFGDAFL